MRVLVTGAGLVGAHTAGQLAERGHAVTVYDVAPDEAYIRGVPGGAGVETATGDITHLPTLLDAVLGREIDAIVHTVGLIGPLAQAHPYAGFAINTLGTVNAAEAARVGGVRRVVYASTHGVYDPARAPDGPLTEDAPVRARSMYAGSKLAAESLLEAYARTYDLDALAVRFCNLFGRGHYRAGSRGGAAFNELVEQPLRGQTAIVRTQVLGPGEWLYGKDAASALVAAVERPPTEGFAVVNVGSGVISTLEDRLAAVRAAIPGARFDVPGGAAASAEHGRSQPFDLARARALLGFAPTYDLRAAVADYVADLRAAGLRRAQVPVMDHC